MALERPEADTFLTLASELHFGRTAERLLISRANVSKTIKKLERRVGAPLFVRTSRHVALTPLGRRLYEELAPLYLAIDQAVSRAIATGQGIAGTLRVGFVGALWGRIFLDAAETFRSQWPQCELVIREIAFGEGFRPLRDGQLDLVNASFPIEDPDLTASQVLFNEPRVLAVSARHPLAARDHITPEDLTDVELLTTPTMPDYWSAARAPRHTPTGLRIRTGPPASSLQELLALVAAAKGAFPLGAQMNDYYQRPDIAYVPIHDSPPIEWGLVWPTHQATPLIKAFTDHVNRHLSATRA